MKGGKKNLSQIALFYTLNELENNLRLLITNKKAVLDDTKFFEGI